MDLFNSRNCHGKICRSEIKITGNGTTIEAVSVTGEAIRLVVPVASKERVPEASHYGAIFAITANRKSLIRPLSR